MKTKWSLGVVAVVVGTLLGAQPSRSDTIYIDATIGMQTISYGGGASEHLTPFYSLNPGVTVDFGTITLFPFLISPPGYTVISWQPALDVGYTPNYFISSVGLSGGLVDSCNVGGDPNCPGDLTLGHSVTLSLLFTIPSDGTGIQLGWSAGFGNFDYTAAVVPLPSALPLFASGLGALGLLGWRRKRKAAAVAA